MTWRTSKGEILSTPSTVLVAAYNSYYGTHSAASVYRPRLPERLRHAVVAMLGKDDSGLELLREVPHDTLECGNACSDVIEVHAGEVDDEYEPTVLSANVSMAPSLPV